MSVSSRLFFRDDMALSYFSHTHPGHCGEEYQNENLGHFYLSNPFQKNACLSENTRKIVTKAIRGYSDFLNQKETHLQNVEVLHTINELHLTDKSFNLLETDKTLYCQKDICKSLYVWSKTPSVSDHDFQQDVNKPELFSSSHVASLMNTHAVKGYGLQRIKNSGPGLSPGDRGNSLEYYEPLIANFYPDEAQGELSQQNHTDFELGVDEDHDIEALDPVHVSYRRKWLLSLYEEAREMGILSKTLVSDVLDRCPKASETLWLGRDIFYNNMLKYIIATVISLVKLCRSSASPTLKCLSRRLFSIDYSQGLVGQVRYEAETEMTSCLDRTLERQFGAYLTFVASRNTFVRDAFYCHEFVMKFVQSRAVFSLMSTLKFKQSLFVKKAAQKITDSDGVSQQSSLFKDEVTFQTALLTFRPAKAPFFVWDIQEHALPSGDKLEKASKVWKKLQKGFRLTIGSLMGSAFLCSIQALFNNFQECQGKDFEVSSILPYHLSGFYHRHKHAQEPSRDPDQLKTFQMTGLDVMQTGSLVKNSPYWGILTTKCAFHRIGEQKHLSSIMPPWKGMTVIKSQESFIKLADQLAVPSFSVFKTPNVDIILSTSDSPRDNDFEFTDEMKKRKWEDMASRKDLLYLVSKMNPQDTPFKSEFIVAVSQVCKMKPMLDMSATSTFPYFFDETSAPGVYTKHLIPDIISKMMLCKDLFMPDILARNIVVNEEWSLFVEKMYESLDGPFMSFASMLLNMYESETPLPFLARQIKLLVTKFHANLELYVALPDTLIPTEANPREQVAKLNMIINEAILLCNCSPTSEIRQIFQEPVMCNGLWIVTPAYAKIAGLDNNPDFISSELLSNKHLSGSDYTWKKFILTHPQVMFMDGEFRHSLALPGSVFYFPTSYVQSKSLKHDDRILSNVNTFVDSLKLNKPDNERFVHVKSVKRCFEVGDMLEVLILDAPEKVVKACFSHVIMECVLPNGFEIRVEDQNTKTERIYTTTRWFFDKDTPSQLYFILHTETYIEKATSYLHIFDLGSGSDMMFYKNV